MWKQLWEKKNNLTRKVLIIWNVCFQTILAFTWIDFTPAKYGDYVFPFWANAIGWALSFSSVSLIPIVAIYKIIREKGSFIEVRQLQLAWDVFQNMTARIRLRLIFADFPFMLLSCISLCHHRWRKWNENILSWSVYHIYFCLNYNNISAYKKAHSTPAWVGTTTRGVYQT